MAVVILLIIHLLCHSLIFCLRLLQAHRAIHLCPPQKVWSLAAAASVQFYKGKILEISNISDC